MKVTKVNSLINLNRLNYSQDSVHVIRYTSRHDPILGNRHALHVANASAEFTFPVTMVIVGRSCRFVWIELG